MKTYTQDEYTKKYGAVGLQRLNEVSQKPGFIDRTKQAASAGIQKIKESNQQIQSGNPLKFAEGAIKAGAGAIETALSPVTAATQPVVSPAFDAVFGPIVEKLAQNPEFQKFANSKAGETTSRFAEDMQNLSTIAGTVGGIKATPEIAGAVGNTAENVATKMGSAGARVAKKVEPGMNIVKDAAKDIKPTYSKIIRHEVTKALDLTPGDTKNILQSTGNDVGSFMAKNKLIGNNVEDTTGLLKSFYKKNYDSVRTEIKNVTKNYNAIKIPRFKEALGELKKAVDGVAGLQEVSTKVQSLLKKKIISLDDVQQLKELMDEHFKLYKVTGDVKEGIAKQGLATIRKDLKQFIEQEVKKTTGKNIRTMNNNVSTAKSILSAIEDRSTRGLTRNTIGLTDLGTFGVAGIPGGPVGGVIAVLIKKMIESPSVRLRVARFLDGLEQTKLLKIKNQLETGQIPEELKPLIKD